MDIDCDAKDAVRAEEREKYDKLLRQFRLLPTTASDEDASIHMSVGY